MVGPWVVLGPCGADLLPGGGGGDIVQNHYRVGNNFHAISEHHESVTNQILEVGVLDCGRPLYLPFVGEQSVVLSHPGRECNHVRFESLGPATNHVVRMGIR